MDILLSIKPKYAEKILAGRKKYEYRRVAPVHPVDRVFMYATLPVGKIVGYFHLGELVHENVTHLWENYCPCEDAMTQDDFFGYFEGAENGYAMEVCRPVTYRPAIEYSIHRTVQNFSYVPDRSGIGIPPDDKMIRIIHTK